MKSGRLTALISEEQLKELEPRSSQWVSDLMSISSHRHESLVPGCKSSTNAVAGKCLLEMTLLSTTGSASYSRHKYHICGSFHDSSHYKSLVKRQRATDEVTNCESSEDNQRIAHLLGADLNESSMSWTSSLATPIISSCVVTPLHYPTPGSLKKELTGGSSFLPPILTPRAPLSNIQERQTMPGSSSRRIQVHPRTLFSASTSHLFENSNTNLSLDVGKTMISSTTAASVDGNNLVSDAELVAVSSENELSERLKKDSQRSVFSTNLRERQPIIVSDVKVNKSSSVIGNPSDDALSLFFQSPEVGAQRKLRQVPKQRAKRKHASSLTPGLELSPNVSHSPLFDSEHSAYDDQIPLAQNQKDFSLCKNKSSFFHFDKSFKRSKLASATDAESRTSVVHLPDDIPSNIDVAFSQQKVCVESPIMPWTSSITDVIIENAKDAIHTIKAYVSTASSIGSKAVMETMDPVLESKSLMHNFAPSEVTTKRVSTVRPIFSRNHSKLQSPLVSFQPRCVNQSFSDLVASPFSILPECTSTPIRVLAKVQEHQGKNLSPADVYILQHKLDSGTGPMNQSNGSFWPNPGVTVVPARDASSSSRCNSETSSQSLLQSLKKPRKFVYPTAAQIAKTCPKKVFSFQSKPTTACGNSQNLVREMKTPAVSFHSLKHCVLPAAAFPAANESIPQHIIPDEHLNPSSGAEQTSSRVVSLLGNTYRGDDALLMLDSESHNASITCPQSLLPSELCLSNPRCSTVVQQNSYSAKSYTAETNQGPLAVSSLKNFMPITNRRYTEHENRNEPLSLHATALTDICTTSPEAVRSESRHDSYIQEPFGFRMASGKQVSISETAMARVENLLNDLIFDTGISACNMQPSQKTGGIYLESTSNAVVSVDFKSAGGRSLSVSSAAEARAKQMMETVLWDPIDDGGLLVDASLATSACDTRVGVEFKSDGKNKISLLHTNYPDSPTLAAGDVSNSAIFDTSCSALQPTDGVTDRNSKRLRQDTLPQGFRPYKTPRVLVKKQAEQSEPKSGKIIEKERGKCRVMNAGRSDFSIARVFPDEICCTLTNTQLAEVTDVSLLLQHQVDLLSTQGFGSETLNRQDYEEVCEDSTRIVSGEAKNIGMSTVCETGDSSKARAHVKDSVCDDNMNMDSAKAWDVVTGTCDHFRDKHEALDNEMMTGVPDCETDEAKSLLYYVANTAFDNSMEFCSTSDQSNAESNFQFQVGFQTAKGNPVKISSAALEKAKCILDDTSSDVKAIGSESSFPIGFQTAKGNLVKISSAALEKAKCILDDTSSDVKAIGYESSFPIGFQTAKGNPVKISSAALEKAKCILDDTSSDVKAIGSESNFPIGFQTAKGNLVKINSAALEKAKCILDDTSSDVKAIGYESSFPIGFQTAKGNPVKISPAALEKAKCILDDTSSDVKAIGSESNFPIGFQTAKGNLVKINSAALEKAKCILDDTSRKAIGSQSGFPIGFQTAKGNAVKICSAALEGAKCILDDTSSDVKAIGSDSNFSIPFQTAKGNPVKISSAAFERAKCFLDDTSSDVKAIGSESTFPIGFQIAKGNPVKIGSAAFEKAKCILDDTSSDVKAIGYESSFPIGFQTAKGNPVKISSAALERAKCILDDTSSDVPTESDSTFPIGFQTAKGNLVKISSAALETAKSFLRDSSSDVMASESSSTFPVDFNMSKAIPECSSSDALNFAKTLFSETECEGKSICEDLNKKAEDLAIVSDCLKTSNDRMCEEGCCLAPVKRNEMHVAAFHDVNDWTESTDEDLLAAEVGPSVLLSTDLLSPALIVGSSFAKEDKNGEERSRDHLSHTHSGPHENSDRSCGCQRFSSYTTLPESFKHDRQGGLKSLDDTPVHNKTPGASSRHFRLLTALWSYPNPDVTSSTIVSSDVNSAVAAVVLDSKQNSKFLTPYKTFPPQNVDKTAGKAPAFAVPNVSGAVDVQRSIKHGQQCSAAAKSNPTLSMGCCPNVAKTTEKLAVIDVGGSSEKCSDFSEAGTSADAYKKQVVVDDRALHNDISGSQRKMVSVCEKVRELRSLAREEQLGRVASKNHHRQNVRSCPGQLWLSRKKCSGVKRIPIGCAVSGKRPQSFSRQQLYSYGVLHQTMNITARNAENFHFDIAETFSTETAMSSVGCHGADGAYLVFTENGQLGKEEFCNALMDMPGVAPYLINRNWVYNHFRWIVWKLAAMEVAFPEEFAGRCLTPNNVMMQLKYRYDREVDHSQRSAVKKIFEKDDTSKKTLVLCVSSIFSSNSLELTDGWYSIKAMLDGPLSRLVDCRKIRAGEKLCVFGSDLVGLNEAAAPLEAPEGVALKICANSTRLAKWDTRLGFLHMCRPPKFPIVSVYPDGGMVGCLDVVLTRIYPIQYLEKFPDGSSVMRTSASEQKAVQEHEKRREKCIEKLSNRFQQKFEKEWESGGSSAKSRSTRHMKPSEIHSAVELYELYRQASDPGVFESCLTTDQLGMLRRQIDEEQQLRQTDLQECMQSMMSEAENLIPARNVTPLLKIQIAGCSSQDLDAKCQAFFTIWRPSEEVIEMLKEGSRFLIFSISAGVNRVRHCQCNVSFTSVKSTKYKKFPSVDKNFLDLLYEPRMAVNFDELRSRNFIAKYGEVDVAGIVIHVTSPSSDQQNNNKVGNQQQTVYLVDDSEAFLAVKFWGGLALHDVQDSLTVGQVVSFRSLRSQVCCGTIPCAYYSDLSAFSVKYHQRHMRVAVDTLASCVKKANFLSVMTELLQGLITHRSAADGLQKEDTKTNVIPSIANNSSINKKVHFSGLRQVSSRAKQSSNQKPVVSYMIDDNFEEVDAKGNTTPPLECKVSEDNRDELLLTCNIETAAHHVPTDEKLSSHLSGIETIDWCDDSAEDANSLAITDINSKNLSTADSRSVKQTRKRMRIETVPVPTRKSSRLK